MKGTIEYVPLEVATIPLGHDVLLNQWFSTHPEKGLEYFTDPIFFSRTINRSDYIYPQCNPNRNISEKLFKRPDYKNEIIFVPMVFPLSVILHVDLSKKDINLDEYWSKYAETETHTIWQSKRGYFPTKKNSNGDDIIPNSFIGYTIIENLCAGLGIDQSDITFKTHSY